MTTELEIPDHHIRRIQPSTAAGDALISRAAQEVQAKIAIAQRFPRDEDRSITRIIRACQQILVAEDAEYEFPRGNEIIIGPTIRLAEVMAQGWGNIDFGTIEIEQVGHESHILSYAWDLETNCSSSKQFTARHIRERKKEKGGNVLLTDPRDVYEAVANFASRRTRSCILAVIPRYVQDLAVSECHKTLQEMDQRPTEEKLKEMVTGFGSLGVSVEMLRVFLKHAVADTTPREILKLRRIYSAIKDNEASIRDYFLVPEEKRKPEGGEGEKSKSQKLAEEVGAKKTRPGQSKQSTGKPSAGGESGPSAASGPAAKPEEKPTREPGDEDEE